MQDWPDDILLLLLSPVELLYVDEMLLDVTEGVLLSSLLDCALAYFSSGPSRTNLVVAVLLSCPS